MADGRVTVSDQCLSCGLCAGRCPENALEVRSIAPSQELVQDYFYGFRPEL